MGLNIKKPGVAHKVINGGMRLPGKTSQPSQETLKRLIAYWTYSRMSLKREGIQGNRTTSFNTTLPASRPRQRCKVNLKDN